MKHLMITLRIRPARVVVLIDQTAAPSEFVRVVRFFSQIWGGRFGVILPVTSNEPALSMFRLRYLRPDFVYGVGLNEETWRAKVVAACSPRLFRSLSSVFAEDVRRAHNEGFIHGDPAIISMFKSRRLGLHNVRPLAVITADQASPLSAHCAGMFGVHHPDLAEKYRDEQQSFDSEFVEDFIDLCLDFSEHGKLTWLDSNSFGLSVHQLHGRSVEPTIVLVENVVSDLSLFWNLRSVSDPGDSPWIIPVPHNQVTRPEAMASLRRWLNQFDPFANYCVVTSQSVSEAACLNFCEELKHTVDGTSIQHVDYDPPRNRLPLVIPFESRVTWPVKLNGRELELIPPTPQILDEIRNSEYWYVDLLNDTRTHRALLDMQLPSSEVISDILNGPCPPQFEHSAVRRFGDGVDSINLRANSGKKAVRFYVPTQDEVLEELLREAGYKIVHDEKRSSYLPTINRFGGLHSAARAVSGQSGEILKTFLAGTQLPSQIRGLCKLGGGELSTNHYADRVKNMSRDESERTKRVARGRFEDYAFGEIPRSRSLGALLEHWVERSVLSRSWQLGPCPVCRQVWFIEELDIQRPILCSNCGRKVPLPEQLRIGYSLVPPIKHAIQEGLIPVVLAGRFLRNMTSNGFFWLPGVKYQKGSDCGDIDILACCDGHLIFAECKTLADASEDDEIWDRVKDQFLELAHLAMECGSRLAVLASQAEKYPAQLVQDLEAVLKNGLAYMLLSRKDLEAGYRQGDDGRRLSMSALLPIEFPEKWVKREGGPRSIDFGAWFRYTRGD